MQWEIAEVPNDSPKTTKRGKTNHPKAVSPQKMSERHAASVQNPSVSSRSGTISTFLLLFLLSELHQQAFTCVSLYGAQGLCSVGP